MFKIIASVVFAQCVEEIKNRTVSKDNLCSKACTSINSTERKKEGEEKTKAKRKKERGVCVCLRERKRESERERERVSMREKSGRHSERRDSFILT